jgi:hypothetical protein
MENEEWKQFLVSLHRKSENTAFEIAPASFVYGRKSTVGFGESAI